MAFTHLHLHTEYSLLDGACRIGKLADRLKSLGMDSCAITDHGVMYGVVDFYSAMKDAGIHPVIGCEAYVCKDHLDHTPAGRETSHLILLCENDVGYQNLMQLDSEAFINGYYYRPRMDYNMLRAHHEGLICLSACLSGDLPKLLLREQYDEARAYIKEMQEIFGKDNFFVEIMDHGIRDEKIVLPRLIRIANEMNVPLVATNDCHYLEKKDAYAQEVLMCIQTAKTLDDPTRMHYETDELYVKSEEEMRELFRAVPDAVERSHEIAMRCNVTFEFGVTKIPHFPIDTGETSLEMLTRLCREGIAKFYPNAKEGDEPYTRLDYEIGVINQMGYVDYFLIVWDFIHYARTNGIMVGPGRGSGVGSIVAYSLEITQVDPLRYNLLFERLLNPERVSMPDIDTDFCYERRQEVIDYVARKYGADHVSQIITFGTMAAKGVVRDVGRVLGMSYQETDVVAKAIPFELNMTLEKALNLSPQLHTMYAEDPQVRKLIDTAMTLEGMPRNASTHAAGVLICGEPVVNYCPLQRNDDVITTQFPKDTVEHLGLLKMDFLGLRTLTVIRDTLDMMRAAEGVDMKVEDIDIYDSALYEMISSGETDGVFQLEGNGMRTFLTNMKPSNFEDIIAAISLYRPGPMDSIPRYIAGKQDPKNVVYATEKLRPILDVTYGCMVYQEQVMQIVRDLAGYSYGRSDLVRRAMAKKKLKIMEQERQNFVYGQTDEKGQVIIPGCVRNGVSEEVANGIYDEMISFASYAFNKSHAAAYSVVAMQTAWLKYYHPVAYMAAIINSVYGNANKIASYVQYCRAHDISILPPDINHSGWQFTAERDDQGKLGIRFGLGAVKGAGQGAIESLVKERQRGPFKNIFDFCQRINTTECSKRVVENLIYAGALDEMGGNRPQLLAVYEPLIDANVAMRKKTSDGQISLFDLTMDDETQPVFPDTRTFPPLKEFPARVRLSYEKEVTGVYISGHPLDDYREKLEQFTFSTADLQDLDEREDHGMTLDGRTVEIAGILTAVKGKATKKGAYMGFITLEDLTDQIECLVFPKTFERYQGMLAVDDVVVLSGKLSIREEESPKLLVDRVIPIDEWSDLPKRKTEAPAFERILSAPPVPSAYTAPVEVANGWSRVDPPREQPERVHLSDEEWAAKAETKLFLRLTREALPKAHALINLYPGSIPVYAHIAAEKQTLLFPRASWCNGSEACLKRLTDLLGEENVKPVASKQATKESK